MTEDKIVAAHVQTHTSHYEVHYPEHGSRPNDPHYKDFDHFHRTTKNDPEIYQCAVGKRRGDFSDCTLDLPLELHHTHIEWALQNGVDLGLLEHQYPGVSNADELGAWVESAANLEWLCILPGVPVLMADGTEKSIEDVHVGDLVVTAEGSIQPVTATSTKRYRGEVAQFGTAAFTLDHRLRTPGGWSTAAEVVHEIEMLGAHMVRVRCVEDQVAAGVVSAVTVEMVNTLTDKQRSADHLFHDPAMFHLESPDAAPVHLDSDVSLGGDMTSGSVMVLARNRVEVANAARIGAESTRTGAPVGESVVTAGTPLANKKMLWLAPVTPTVGLYSGFVHDLSVAHDHSFIAGGVAVHNCQFHHRGHGGAHVASASDFEGQHFVKRLIT